MVELCGIVKNGAFDFGTTSSSLILCCRTQKIKNFFTKSWSLKVGCSLFLQFHGGFLTEVPHNFRELLCQGRDPEEQEVKVQMADYGSLSSPTNKYGRPSSSIFTSPRLFTGFTSKGITETDSIMSPTSILDSKSFSALKSPFRFDKTPKSPKPENRNHWDTLDSRGVGLGLVDVLTNEISDPKLSKPESRMVLFGSQLKIQIPPLHPSVFDSPMSPGDFGIKTRNSQLGSFSPLLSPSSSRKSPFGSSNSGLENSNSPRIFSGCLSDEMELSEEYTCVITHGPNPTTTHIFDDCIIESCRGVVGFCASSKKANAFAIGQSLSYPSESFLRFCYNCKKNLGHGKDIYMYRGEKAFCSSECRYKEIISEEAMEKSDDIYGT